MEETHGAGRREAGTGLGTALWPGCDGPFSAGPGTTSQQEHSPGVPRGGTQRGRGAAGGRWLRSQAVMHSAHCKDSMVQSRYPAPGTRAGYGMPQECPAGLPKAPPQDGATPQSPCHGPLSSPVSLAANSSFWKMKSGTGKTASYTTASAPKSSCESHNWGAPTFPTEVALTKG